MQNFVSLQVFFYCGFSYEDDLQVKNKNTPTPVITIDDAWIYLSDYNRKKKSIYYQKRREKDLRCWFQENKENFAKGYIIITGFSFNEKRKKVREVGKKVNTFWITLRNIFQHLFSNKTFHHFA